MSDLQDKYLHQTHLSPEELEELVKQVNATADDDLGQAMEEAWMDDDSIDMSLAEKWDSAGRWSSINKRIHTSVDYRKRRVLQYLQIAAVVLLPILVATSVVLYHENKSYASDQILVSTGDNERATITLPDGTQVNMNEESSLRYYAKSFKKDKRQVEFDGEGYFQVRKDAERPFMIQTDGVEVNVLGTKFNLQSRKSAKVTELVLEEGSVLFTSVRNGENVTLVPNQKAILDKTTGRISVKELGGDVSDATAWKRREFVFKDKPLNAVIDILEKNYNVTFHFKKKINLNDLFTGTMPSDDIAEDIAILEKLYEFQTVRQGQKVIVK